MDQTIVKLLKNLQEELREIKSVMVTKTDAKNFFTKDDAKNDIATFATKDDIKLLAADISILSNKLDATKEELIKEIGNTDTSVTLSADKNKADRSELRLLETRVTKIERHLNQ